MRPPRTPAAAARRPCAAAAPNLTIKPRAQHTDGIVKTTGGTTHPPGYNAFDKHGYDFDSHGSATCATAGCHGVTLLGGNTGGPSCNTCHTANWQSDCKFCHGTTAHGAPPQGVQGETAAKHIHVG